MSFHVSRGLSTRRAKPKRPASMKFCFTRKAIAAKIPAARASPRTASGVSERYLACRMSAQLTITNVPAISSPVSASPPTMMLEPATAATTAAATAPLPPLMIRPTHHAAQISTVLKAAAKRWTTEGAATPGGRDLEDQQQERGTVDPLVAVQRGASPVPLVGDQEEAALVRLERAPQERSPDEEHGGDREQQRALGVGLEPPPGPNGRPPHGHRLNGASARSSGRLAVCRRARQSWPSSRATRVFGAIVR